MKEPSEKAEPAREQTTYCVACETKCLHIVLSRNRHKVTIECGHCGFISVRILRPQARKLPNDQSTQSRKK